MTDKDLKILKALLQMKEDRRSGILPTAESEEEKLMTKTYLEKAIKEVHHYSIRPVQKKKKNGEMEEYFVTEYLTSDGKKKQKTAKDEEALYDWLYIHYYGEEAQLMSDTSMNGLLEGFLIWKKEVDNVKKKTLKELRSDYIRFIQPTKWASVKIQNMTDEQIRALINSFKRKVTRHQIVKIKGLLNGIFAYAVNKKIISVNVAQQIKISPKFPTLPETQIGEFAYTNEERDKLKKTLWESTNVYDECCLFILFVCDRIGEVRALKWENIFLDKEFIIVKNAIASGDDNDSTYEVDAPLKTGDKGIKYFTLSKMAIGLLERFKDERGNPKDTDYVFPNSKGNFLVGNRIRMHLKDACRRTGVQYRTNHGTHAIRARGATEVARLTKNPKAVQKAGGWVDDEMANRYVANAITEEDKRIANEVFS